jgi:hypothetical protein
MQEKLTEREARYNDLPSPGSGRPGGGSESADGSGATRQTSRSHPKDVETAQDRLKWAINCLQRDFDVFNGLLEDLRTSYTAVRIPKLKGERVKHWRYWEKQLFQLRSIEQNEIVIRTDIMNKAILVFTAVTIVFLPLNFFTSYYGMNVKKLIGPNTDVAYFWKLCGTIAFLIILSVSLYAFRHRIKHLINRSRHHSDRLDDIEYMELHDPSEEMV